MFGSGEIGTSYLKYLESADAALANNLNLQLKIPASLQKCISITYIAFPDAQAKQEASAHMDNIAATGQAYPQSLVTGRRFPKYFSATR